jgi:hypothetical protein
MLRCRWNLRVGQSHTTTRDDAMPNAAMAIEAPSILEHWLLTISYCCSYSDKEYEYRHVQLPKAMLKAIPKEYFDGSRGTLKLLWEDEWRALGITQSLGWQHYEVHEPEPHILLFK